MLTKAHYNAIYFLSKLTLKQINLFIQKNLVIPAFKRTLTHQSPSQEAAEWSNMGQSISCEIQSESSRI